MHATHPRHVLFHSIFFGLVLALGLFGPAAQAEITPWAVNEGGRMRVVTLPPEPDGTVRGALQIEPREGWMTYWREPGEAGIPPQLSFAAESGVELTELDFPIPRQFIEGDIRDIGYDHAVTLPFTLKLKDAAVKMPISTTAFIGLCRNICIPFQADFQVHPASAKLPLQENLILDEARRTLPEAPSPEFHVVSATLNGERTALKLSLKLPPTPPTPEIMVMGPESHVLMDQHKPNRRDDLYEVELPLGKLSGRPDLAQKPWEILVIAGSRAIDAPLLLE